MEDSKGKDLVPKIILLSAFIVSIMFSFLFFFKKKNLFMCAVLDLLIPIIAYLF